MSASLMEKRLFQRSFDDGWLDVLVGTGLLAIGLCWLAGVDALTAVVPAVLFPFWRIGREKLIEPRLGQVRFSSVHSQETHRQLTGWLMVGAAALVTELMILFVLKQSGPTGLSGFAVAIPVWLIGTGLLAGLMTGGRRFIAYSVLSFGLGVAGVCLNLEEPAWLILLAGVIVLGSGLMMLVRFLDRHPMIDPER